MGLRHIEGYFIDENGNKWSDYCKIEIVYKCKESLKTVLIV